jgi:hypothetical protein
VREVLLGLSSEERGESADMSRVEDLVAVELGWVVRVLEAAGMGVVTAWT